VNGFEVGRTLEKCRRTALATWLRRGAILLIACSGAAHAQTWTKFQSTADGFEIDAPAKVETEAEKSDPRLVRSTEYTMEADGLLASVSATLAKVDLNLAGAVGGSFPNFKCKTKVSDQDLPVPGGQARELRGDGCVEQRAIVARYYVVGKWLYQVFALYSPDKKADAARFVDSFKLLNPGAK
jgi:hypothetical protein